MKNTIISYMLLIMCVWPAAAARTSVRADEGGIAELSGHGWKVELSTATGAVVSWSVQDGDCSWQIPFRSDSRRGPAFENVAMHPSGNVPYTFSGQKDSVTYILRYTAQEDHLAVECTVSNGASTTFSPHRVRLFLGVDSEMRTFPEWNGKFFPTLVRCEKDFAWGYFMSPEGRILAFCTGDPVASYGLQYIFEGNKAWLWGHQVYTASLDLLHVPPLPQRHPDSLSALAPGECRSWTLYIGAVGGLDEVKPALSSWTGAPLAQPRKHTLSAGERAAVRVFGCHDTVKAVLHAPDGRVRILEACGGKDFVTPPMEEYGLHRLDISAGGRHSEVSLYVRKPWSWYLRKAGEQVSLYPPFFSASCETFYGYYPAFLASRHFPDSLRYGPVERRFLSGLGRMVSPDGTPRAQANPHRIQNFAALCGMLVDLWEASGDETVLRAASRIGDYLSSPAVQWPDGSYRSSGIHYTAVIYPAKSMFELADAEYAAGWEDAAQRHYSSAVRAAADLKSRMDDIETEGDMTFEDGMITCSALQMALCGLHLSDTSARMEYARAARQMMDKHLCLEQRLVPDCRMRGATLRYWEALDIYFSPNQAMNSPHGWTAWKIYAMHYLYLLTGEEGYLDEMFETLGTCVQLMGLDGKLRWGFIPDPYIDGLVCTPSPGNPGERLMKETVIGEQYMEMISPWLRPEDESAFPVFGEPGGAGDNTVYEIFKALEECAMTLSYVIVEDTGEIRCHNCSAEWTSPGCLLVRADENCVRMLHLNSEVPLDVHFVSGSRTFRASAGKGMSWIGGTRPFPSLSPLP